MDKKVEKKTWTTRRILYLTAGILFVAFFVYAFVFMDSGSTLNVEKERLTIRAVTEQPFQEFITLTGVVQPIKTVYLAALQGGVVENIAAETGTMVQKGDTILTLSNSRLRLNVLQRTSGISNQINQTRNSQLNIKQNSLNLRMQLASAEKQLAIAKAAYQRKKALFEKNILANKDYFEAKENYQYQQKRFHYLYQSFKQDSIKTKRQLRQIYQSLQRMYQSLQGVRNILDRLVIKAPISGQLSTVELNPGQAISASERIGQVAVLDHYKVRANIDEFYLPRIRPGLKASFRYNGNTYKMEINKVYPVVRKGRFKVDLKFLKGSPDELTRGQSLHLQLQLSQSVTKSVVLPRGSFYQSTGGNWVFLVVDGGNEAVRQPVQLGRQNPDYFEVLSGLKPGDKVITSSYGTFSNYKVLNLQ